MPTITIDNRAPTVQFQDGNGLSDGMAAFHAAVLNAGPAAARIRQARERDAVAQAFQEAQGARADRSLDMQQQWHQQDQDAGMAKAGAYAGDDAALQNLSRQAHLDQVARAFNVNDQRDVHHQQLEIQQQLADSQIADRKADNARQVVGQWGEGANELAKRGIDIAKLAFGHQGGGAARSGYTAVTPNDFSGKVYAFDRATGQMREVTPGAAPAAGQPQAAPGTPPPQGAAPTAPTAPRMDNAPRVQEWLPVLSNPGSPAYAASIAKLKAWRAGKDEHGQPFPDGPAWAQAVTDAMRGTPPAAPAPAMPPAVR